MPRWRVIRTANLMHWQVVDRHRVRAKDEKGQPMKWKNYDVARAFAERLNKKDGGEP